MIDICYSLLYLQIVLICSTYVLFCSLHLEKIFYLITGISESTPR